LERKRIEMANGVGDACSRSRHASGSLGSDFAEFNDFENELLEAIESELVDAADDDTATKAVAHPA
jgi:hypothetical protein